MKNKEGKQVAAAGKTCPTVTRRLVLAPTPQPLHVHENHGKACTQIDIFKPEKKRKKSHIPIYLPLT